MTQDVLVKVAMADMGIVGDGGVLRTTGLGSCVGVTVYDPKLKLAAMAHIMLPHSEIAREGNVNIAKYADTAVPELVSMLVVRGAARERLEAKLAGGAQMFAFTGGSDTMRIGPRNVESCKEALKRLAVRIRSEDTGGSFGRTIEFHTATCMLAVRSVQHGTKDI